MNFISTFEELDKLYESVSTEEPLTEGKIIDGLKKVGTRLKADVSTIVRCFAEISGSDALSDLATHVENKAVLKALQSGNEKVLNTLTIDDIEELKQDIKEYEQAKKAKKSNNKQLKETIVNKYELVDNLTGVPVVDYTFRSKEEAANYAIANHLDNVKVLRIELISDAKGKYVYNGRYEYALDKDGQFVDDGISTPIGKQLGEAVTNKYEIVDGSGTPVFDQTFDDKDVACGYVRKYNIPNAKKIVRTELVDGKYNGHYEYNLVKDRNGVIIAEEATAPAGKCLEEEAETVEDEAKQVVLECKKCGALVITNETDLAIDEESDLVNVEDECKFCSEKEGYAIIGSLVPYETVETEEEVEEGLIGDTIRGAAKGFLGI